MRFYDIELMRFIHNRKLVTLGVVLAAFVAPTAVAEQPGNSPVAKANQCVGCHEIPGYRSVYPEVYPVPKILGQSQDYIELALNAYRSGAREHPSMSSIAAQLSDEDIKVLAKFYAEGGE